MPRKILNFFLISFEVEKLAEKLAADLVQDAAANFQDRLSQ
jgi:hypothetical protein